MPCPMDGPEEQGWDRQTWPHGWCQRSPGSHHVDWKDTLGKGRAARVSYPSPFGFPSCFEVFLFKALRF